MICSWVRCWIVSISIQPASLPFLWCKHPHDCCVLSLLKYVEFLWHIACCSFNPTATAGKIEQCDLNPCWLMIIEDYTTEYIGGYNTAGNPYRPSSIMEWYRDFVATARILSQIPVKRAGSLAVAERIVGELRLSRTAAISIHFGRGWNSSFRLFFLVKNMFCGSCFQKPNCRKHTEVSWNRGTP